MLRAGHTYTLTVKRISDFGLYLADDEGEQEVLLPNRYVSLGDREGDRIEVFVYHDSQDRLVATTRKPALRSGEAGFLRVVDRTIHGVFLDWGLEGKDLFMPNRNRQGTVATGSMQLVYIYEDSVTGRCVATSKLRQFVNNDDLSDVAPNQQVDILVAVRVESGYRVIIDNRHWGMIYDNQMFSRVGIGDRMTGYVQRITDDNRIDIILRRPGFDGVQDSAGRLLSALERSGGFLPVGDRSTPEQIARHTQMSKKLFKRSLGMLLRQGAVETVMDGIRLVKRQPK